MRLSDKRYSKSYGQCKVILRQGIECQPFQDIKSGDAVERKYFNRFTYESMKNLYDVEVYYNGDIKYYTNMKSSNKTPHHQAIEEYYEIIKKEQ